MLILTGLVTEIVDGGPRYMLLFSSPRVQGAHYQVQTDSDTADRMRILIAAELKAIAISEQIVGNSDNDEAQPDSGQSGRS
jgi:hypothetical protein